MKPALASPTVIVPPKAHKVLDLSKQFAGANSIAALKEAIKNIPLDITHLILSNNQLHFMGAAKLAKIFKKIPANVIHLDLHGNGLGVIFPALTDVLTAIPRTVVELLLGNNGLSGVGAHLPDILRNALNPNLLLLDLSFNHLSTLPYDVVFRLFRSIPRRVTCLDLSGTNLSTFTIDELALGFAELPPFLASINLGFSQPPLLLPSSHTNDQWAIMLHRMPRTVKRVTYQASRSLVDFLPNTTKIREYTANVLAYMTTLLPELINLVMNYNLDQPTIWPSFYTVTPTPTLEVLDEQGNPITKLIPIQQGQAKKPGNETPSFTAKLTTYPSTFFSPVPGSTIMELDESLIGLELR